MRKKYFHIANIILIWLVFIAFSGTALSEQIPHAIELELLDLINQVRSDPLGVAASLGMDPEKILEDFPELEKILREGLPPLTFNANMAESARVHTRDMFAQGYYSHVSPDGQDYDERIRESGYPAVVSGESLGMILFANFINPEHAVRLIFEYMFQDELDPSRTEKRNILDPCLKDAGISVQSGVLDIGGARWNVYLATCDFGSVMSCPEIGLFELINQARENPLEMAASLGMAPEQVLADFPEWHDLLTQGLPPLNFNTTLAEAARAHAADMLANSYYSHDSLDGRTYEERIRDAGYDPLDTGESLKLKCLDHDDLLANNDNQSQKLIQQIFENIFTRELRPNDTEEKNILNVSLKEVGIGIAYGISPELGGICGDCVILMVMDFGLSSETQIPLQYQTAQ